MRRRSLSSQVLWPLAFCAFVLCLVPATALGAGVENVPDPRKNGGWVIDQAGVLSGATEGDFNYRLQQLHDDLQVEGVVVTLERVKGPPDDFARELYYFWELGRMTDDRAFLILLVVRERGLAVFPGPELREVLTDTWLVELQRDQMAPEFRRKKYLTGLEVGIDEIDRRLRSNWKMVAPIPVVAGKPEGFTEEEGSSGWLWGVLTVGVTNAVLLSAFGYFYFRRRKRRDDDEPPSDDSPPDATLTV